MNDLVRGKFVVDEPEKLFFTADPHFFHANIIGHCNRPFRDVHEMNEALIANWNAVVPEDADILILGDIFWREDKIQEYKAIALRLSGRKRLVRGNHDYLDDEAYLGMGFLSVHNYLEVKVDHAQIACFHYPILEWNGFYKGDLHFHGHVHGKGRHFSGRVLDVGVDANNFTPVRWIQIRRKLLETAAREKAELKGVEKHKLDISGKCHA